MPAFTNETAVRLKFQVDDLSVSAALVEQCIADAHTEILGLLDPGVDPQNPEDALILGETLLAGAALLTALAASEAVAARSITIGGQRIEAGQRFASLLAMASKSRREAWRTLARYCAARPPAQVGSATDTTPVLGA